MIERTVPGRADFAWFHRVTTRWMDNDVYGHVNNAHYYSFFDTAINAYLIAEGGLDIRHGPVVGYVVKSACDYFLSVAYPGFLEVGIRVDRMGSSSVHYGVALFAAGDDRARAAGTMVHVFVDRETSKAAAIPASFRTALESIAAGPFPDR